MQALLGYNFSCRGDCAGKSRGGSRIAKFYHQKVPQGLAGDEWGGKIAAFIVSGGLIFIEENDEMIVGFGCQGLAIFSDIPGVCFQVVKIAHVSLWPYSKARKRLILNFNGENTVLLFTFFTLFLNNRLKISTLLRPYPRFSPLPFTVLLLIRLTYLLASMRLTWASADGTFSKASGTVFWFCSNKVMTWAYSVCDSPGYHKASPTWLAYKADRRPHPLGVDKGTRTLHWFLSCPPGWPSPQE